MLELHAGPGAEFDVAHVPLVAIAAVFVGGDARREALVEPRRRHDLAAVHRAAIDDKLADAREIARGHSQAGCRRRFAVARSMLLSDPGILARNPLGLTDAERIE